MLLSRPVIKYRWVSRTGVCDYEIHCIWVILVFERKMKEVTPYNLQFIESACITTYIYIYIYVQYKKQQNVLTPWWNFQNLEKVFSFLCRTGSVDCISNMLGSNCISHGHPPQSMIASPPAIMMAPLDFCLPW